MKDEIRTFPHRLYRATSTWTYGHYIEAKTLLTAPRNNETSRRFILYGTGRSGSTLLADLLNSHPAIHCIGEILRHPLYNPYTHIERLSRCFKEPVWGCKILSYQLSDIQKIVDQKSFIERLVSNGYQIIYMRRTNIVRQRISYLVGSQRATWHTSSNTAMKRVTIDPKQLIRAIEECEQLKHKENQILSGLDCFETNYERDLATEQGQKEMLPRLLKRLNCEPLELHSTVKRTSSHTLEDTLENAEEIHDTIKQSKWSHLI